MVAAEAGVGALAARYEVNVPLVAAFFVALTGCFAADEDHFPESFANVYCLRMEECARGLYESKYDADMQDCIDDIQDATEDLAKASDEFDDDDAVDCLDQMRSETCGDWAEGEPDDCGRVYAITLQDLFD